MNTTEKIIATLLNFKSRCRPNSKNGCRQCKYRCAESIWKCIEYYLGTRTSADIYVRLMPVIRQINETCMENYEPHTYSCKECKYFYGRSTAMCCISQALYIEWGVELFEHLLDKNDLVEEGIIE